jgi:hypothetical protein
MEVFRKWTLSVGEIVFTTLFLLSLLQCSIQSFGLIRFSQTLVGDEVAERACFSSVVC